MLPGPGASGADHLPGSSTAKHFYPQQPHQGGAEESSCSNSDRGASHRRVCADQPAEKLCPSLQTIKDIKFLMFLVS